MYRVVKDWVAQQGIPMTLEVYQPKLMVLKFQHVSQTLRGLLKTPCAGPTLTRDLEASILGWGLVADFSDGFPDAADAAGLEPILREPWP